MSKVSSLFLAAMFVLGTSLAGQSTEGKIAGIVRDTSKATIPGVEVSLVNTETRAILRTVSNERGEFQFQVPAGYYELAARLPGFQSARVPEFRVKAGGTVQIEPVEMSVVAIRPRMVPPESASPRWIPLSR